MLLLNMLQLFVALDREGSAEMSSLYVHASVSLHKPCRRHHLISLVCRDGVYRHNVPDIEGELEALVLLQPPTQLQITSQVNG